MFGKAEAELMDDIYSALYKYEGKENMHDKMRSDNLVGAFDEYMETDEDFRQSVQEIVKARGDLITSDREAAAFMLMWEFA